jgi:cytidylate kinase
MVAKQRSIGERASVVMEGRDIGTVVFPDAEAKFFLTAHTDERARRRVAELTAAGKPVDAAQTKAEIIARDTRDSTRATAPLRKADDAIEIDSSALDPDAVVNRMADVVMERSR